MPEIQCRDLSSIQDLLACLADDTKDWTSDGFAKPWFRGVTDGCRHKLQPSILRGGNKGKEFQITKKFRLMAPGFGATPDTGRLDQWLFLMQHHGAPTRLLDWTESPLVAAFFAAELAAKKDKIKQDAAIYALDPMALNKASGLTDNMGTGYFPVTWVQNEVLQTIKFAFGTEKEPVFRDDGTQIEYLKFPVAIFPSTVHARLSSQRGVFTLHGDDIRDLETIFSDKSLFPDKSLITEKQLVRYRIPKDKLATVFGELSDLGITRATLFPDLDGLAEGLRYSFKIDD